MVSAVSHPFRIGAMVFALTFGLPSAAADPDPQGCVLTALPAEVSTQVLDDLDAEGLVECGTDETIAFLMGLLDPVPLDAIKEASFQVYSTATVYEFEAHVYFQDESNYLEAAAMVAFHEIVDISPEESFFVFAGSDTRPCCSFDRRIEGNVAGKREIGSPPEVALGGMSITFPACRWPALVSVVEAVDPAVPADWAQGWAPDNSALPNRCIRT